MKLAFTIIGWYFCLVTHAFAAERCLLGDDVPERVRFPGVLVLILEEPQCFAFYEKGILSTRSIGRPLYGYASTGMSGYETPFSDPARGPHRIIRSYRHYWSNKYKVRSGGRLVRAYMPYSLFFTDDGHALHEGRVDRMHASHGCVRLPTRAAEILFHAFSHDEVQVVIAPDRYAFQRDWERR